MPPSLERLGGQLVAQPQAGLGVGRAAGLQRVDRAEDPVRIGGRAWLEHDPRVRAVLDDRDRVARAQPVDEEAERLLDELEPVLAGHRARGVDDERQGASGRSRRATSSP